MSTTILTPTPLASFLGGVGLPLSMHALVVLNGSVFGISGFLHRSVRGNKEALAAVSGLVAGGVVVGLVERAGNVVGVASQNLPMSQLLLAGFLVGIGTKMGSGCTSGHMLAGIGRLSKRSFVATTSFFATGLAASRLFHAGDPTYTSTPVALENVTANFGTTAQVLLGLQLIPMAISYVLYKTAPHIKDGEKPKTYAKRRIVSAFNSAAQFSLALALSNLTDMRKVISFLHIPTGGFDPSLAFLAVGALPLAIFLAAKFTPTKRVPALGGPWSIPKNGEIDTRLVCGAAIFGVGWGLAGVCPGPGLVNLGRSLVSGSGISTWIGWLGAVIIGGIFETVLME